MSKQLRLGWVGAGGFARWGLLPCLRDCGQIAFVALCDRQSDLARDAAERYGARRWYTDVGTMLVQEELDAVAVVGPPAPAIELAIQCLERGLPVYVEKPLGLNEAQARALAEIAARHGTTGQVGFNWRHAPAFRRAHDIIRSPAFGSPTYLESHHHEACGSARVWECADEAQSWLLLHGVHAVDQLRYQFGEVTEVYTRVATRGYAVVLTSSVSFANGASGFLSLHGGYPHTDCSVLAVGDRRTSVWTLNFEELECGSDERGACVPPELGVGAMGSAWRANFTENRPERMGYRYELQSFADSILAGREPQPSLADAVLTMRLCDAIYRSGVEGVPVQVAAG